MKFYLLAAILLVAPCAFCAKRTGAVTSSYKVRASTAPVSGKKARAARKVKKPAAPKPAAKAVPAPAKTVAPQPYSVSKSSTDDDSEYYGVMIMPIEQPADPPDATGPTAAHQPKKKAKQASKGKQTAKPEDKVDLSGYNEWEIPPELAAKKAEQDAAEAERAREEQAAAAKTKSAATQQLPAYDDANSDDDLLSAENGADEGQDSSANGD